MSFWKGKGKAKVSNNQVHHQVTAPPASEISLQAHSLKGIRSSNLHPLPTLGLGTPPFAREQAVGALRGTPNSNSILIAVDTSKSLTSSSPRERSLPSSSANPHNSVRAKWHLCITPSRQLRRARWDLQDLLRREQIKPKPQPAVSWCVTPEDFGRLAAHRRASRSRFNVGCSSPPQPLVRANIKPRVPSPLRHMHSIREQQEYSRAPPLWRLTLIQQAGSEDEHYASATPTRCRFTMPARKGSSRTLPVVAASSKPLPIQPSIHGPPKRKPVPSLRMVDSTPSPSPQAYSRLPPDGSDVEITHRLTPLSHLTNAGFEDNMPVSPKTKHPALQTLLMPTAAEALTFSEPLIPIEAAVGSQQHVQDIMSEGSSTSSSHQRAHVVMAEVIEHSLRPRTVVAQPPSANPRGKQPVVATALPIYDKDKPLPPLHMSARSEAEAASCKAKKFTVPANCQVPVKPPQYKPYEKTGYQWVSESRSCSRPLDAWAPSKRWACCECEGTTIVEQQVCARLHCQHARCTSRCVMTDFNGEKPYMAC